MNLNIDIYCVICEFLNPSDIKNLINSNKLLNNNIAFKLYIKKIILNRSTNILINFWRDYVSMCKIYRDDVYLTKKALAFQFFRYYEKKYIKLWYNNHIEWKKKIIDKYKIKHTESPTRLELFKLILKIPIDDVSSIGW